jgi:hypothetical protein
VTWIGLIVGGLWVLIGLLTSGISGFLISAGTLALFTALFVVISGRESWARIPSRRAGALLLAASVVVVIVGGAVAPAKPSTVVQFADTSGSDTALTSPTPSQSPTTKAPVVTTEEVKVVESIPFESTTVDDSNLAAGVTQVSTAGVAGTKTTTYRVTKTDGKETGRVPVGEALTVPPVAQVTSNGTYVAPPPPPAPVADASGCDPNYDGGCVPIASDVDCAGGSGDGPAYVSGPVYVIGGDIYKLDRDRDGDGIACD